MVSDDQIANLLALRATHRTSDATNSWTRPLRRAARTTSLSFFTNYRIPDLQEEQAYQYWTGDNVEVVPPLRLRAPRSGT